MFKNNGNFKQNQTNCVGIIIYLMHSILTRVLFLKILALTFLNLLFCKLFPLHDILTQEFIVNKLIQIIIF